MLEMENIVHYLGSCTKLEIKLNKSATSLSSKLNFMKMN